MGWSTRLFLLSADDALHRLASAAFGRMLRPGSRCRLPDFAGQRVRLASVTIELANGHPLGVRHLSFSMLDIDVDGLVDIARLNAHQVARVDTLLAGVLEPRTQPTQQTPVIDATSRFIARGGAWEPDHRLRRSIEAAAMEMQPCPRVRVVG